MPPSLGPGRLKMLEGVERKLLAEAIKAGGKLLQRWDNRGLPMNYCLW